MRKLIDQQAALDAVDDIHQEHLYRQIGDRDTYTPYNEGWADACNRIDAALSALPSAQPEPQWIPCSERLPEDDVEVLVTDDAGGVQWLGVDKMLSYEDGSGRFWLVSQNPSAWMPLPAPYRSEGEKK